MKISLVQAEIAYSNSPKSPVYGPITARCTVYTPRQFDDEHGTQWLQYVEDEQPLNGGWETTLCIVNDWDDKAETTADYGADCMLDYLPYASAKWELEANDEPFATITVSNTPRIAE